MKTSGSMSTFLNFRQIWCIFIEVVEFKSDRQTRSNVWTFMNIFFEQAFFLLAPGVKY